MMYTLHFSRTCRFEGLKDFETLRKETLKPNAGVLKIFAQSWKPGMENMNFLFRVQFSGCTTSYEAMTNAWLVTAALVLSHLRLPNHDSKADKPAQERGAQYMDWDKSATPDAKDSGTYRQWPSTRVGNLLHNVRCTLEPQNVWLCRCFSFPKGISSGLKAWLRQ